jgi:excinuclease ABC subunit A
MTAIAKDQKIKPKITPVKHESVIEIKGARVHNLKNIDVILPKKKLIVITGVSGSGKSSLLMDTIYAEGQRRYVESLSAYARQFLGRMNKPDVDYIKGLSPAIAIEQRVTTRTSRSTVGSLTEIYDYLKLLFARIGKTISPVSGEVVKKNEVSDVVDFVKKLADDLPLFILSPFKKVHHRSVREELQIFHQKGFVRVWLNDKAEKIEDLLQQQNDKNLDKIAKEIYIVVDRLVTKKNDADTETRVADSVQIAFFEGEGECFIKAGDKAIKKFSNRFEADGIIFEEPTPQFFSYNNPYGACKTCEGFGTIIGIDEDLVFPDKNLSVYEGAIAPWKGEKMGEWLTAFLKDALKFDFPIHRAYKDLSKKEKQLLWTGNHFFYGLNDFFKELERQTYKIQYRVMLSRFRGRTICPECNGSRLRKDASYVKVGDRSISEIVLMQISDVSEFFEILKVNAHDEKISLRILTEIKQRLQFMLEVGLGYLTLNRLSSSLSGGETQRIHLTRTLGSNLTSSLYILDEPSIGLHPKDTGQLVKVLHRLRDLGNTVLVVEHEEEIMRKADHIVDLGPLAGTQGGEIIFNGNFENIFQDKNSLTGKYLRGDEKICVPEIRRKWMNKIELIGCSEHNLKNIDVTFPLNAMTVVTGVSGSGKTTLVKQILYPSLQKLLGGFSEVKTGSLTDLTGDYKKITQVEMVDQNPLGKSSRSNPVTYIKAYDLIRDLYAEQHLSKMSGFKPKHFSFNVEGGRCEVCKGEGEIVVEMQFLADIHLTCEECKGRRFKDEVLDVHYKEKNIFDVLEMTVDEAIEFFWEEEKIVEAIKPLADVGLGYVKLGQSSSTLSGGEAQRVKLASYLGKGNLHHPVLFIFDEPTTGLHFHDIKKLLKSFDALIDHGHSVVVIEHNLDVVKCADHIIDLGPGGGEDGGNLIFQGTPEDLVKVKKSFTAEYLSTKL